MTQMQTKFKQTEIWLIPEDWEVVELGEITSKVISWGTPKTTNKEYYENWNILWLNTWEVNFNRIYDTEKKITELWLKESSARLVNKNSVIIAMYWATAWKVAINKVELSTNQACCNLTIDNTKSDYNYIFYYLVNKYDVIKNLSTWAAQQNLNTIMIKKLKLLLPPLPEQKAIAEILSSLDDKIELLEKQNKTLENIGQALFKSWFVNFEPFQNDLVESEMGMIPRGWKVGKVGDLVDFIVDNRWKTPETVEPNEFDFIPLIEINALIWTWRCVNVNLAKKWVTNEVYETWFRKWHPERWDVLFSTVWSIWEMALVFDEKICIAQNIVSLRPKVGWEFVYELLSYIKPNLLWLDISTVQPSIKLPHLLNFEILIPNNEIIEKFILKSKDISEKIYKNNLQIQTLSSLRDSLLPRLMSGKIRVV